MLRWLIRALVALGALGALYLAVTLVQVWQASRKDQARKVQAIVVLGAAQYNGRPSPVLKARLDHAYRLWKEHLSDTIVVTGGKQPGDRFTEAQTSADYLATLGVPDSAVLREVEGRNSWQSLAAAAVFLKARDRTVVLLVSDPFHNERIQLMAGELGLKPYVSPTRTSPISGMTKAVYFGKETVEVALGRIVGFRRLVGVSNRVRGQVPSGLR
jgi:uncharacterized SAM-binding protein YcdF (DUF218 family)